MDKLGLNQPIHGEHDFYGSKHAQMSPASCAEWFTSQFMLDFSGWQRLSNKPIWMESFSLEFVEMMNEQTYR